MRVASLHLYPIKGCRGHAVESATLDDLGFAGDRRMMLVDRDGRFVSQREIPALATLVPGLAGGTLSVEREGSRPFMHRLASDGETVDVSIWGNTVAAVDQGSDAAEWFSRQAGVPLRLVAWGPASLRRLDPEYVPGDHRGTSFTDGYPVLGVLEESLEDLNRRLAEPVPMNRFRPNIVVAGGEPWSEDGWRSIRIGAVTFDAVKPCARCVVTTTDQVTGDRHLRQEPLRTLASFRTVRGLGAIFGQNLVHRSSGTIRQGDAVRRM